MNSSIRNICILGLIGLLSLLIFSLFALKNSPQLERLIKISRGISSSYPVVLSAGVALLKNQSQAKLVYDVKAKIAKELSETDQKQLAQNIGKYIWQNRIDIDSDVKVKVTIIMMQGSGCYQQSVATTHIVEQPEDLKKLYNNLKKTK